jgi:hypothetical protein
MRITRNVIKINRSRCGNAEPLCKKSEIDNAVAKNAVRRFRNDKSKLANETANQNSVDSDYKNI